MQQYDVTIWLFVSGQAKDQRKLGKSKYLPFSGSFLFKLAFQVLVSTELVVKKDEFLKVVQSNEEPEGGCVIEEVIVSSPKPNEEGASLRCPKCGTNAGSEAYYNNSDNICYLTYCTKCVHEHGLYVRLETDEEEISQKEKKYLETQKLKKEREASKIKEKCKDFVEFSLDGSGGSCANDFNPVSRVLKGRSHYEVIKIIEIYKVKKLKYKNVIQGAGVGDWFYRGGDPSGIPAACSCCPSWQEQGP